MSVDPARDSPEHLHRYATSFHPTFRGVTGGHEQLSRLADSLGVVYGAVASGSAGE